jgi:hypothetical protein
VHFSPIHTIGQKQKIGFGRKQRSEHQSQHPVRYCHRYKKERQSSRRNRVTDALILSLGAFLPTILIGKLHTVPAGSCLALAGMKLGFGIFRRKKKTAQHHPRARNSCLDKDDFSPSHTIPGPLLFKLNQICLAALRLFFLSLRHHGWLTKELTLEITIDVCLYPRMALLFNTTTPAGGSRLKAILKYRAPGRILCSCAKLPI